MEARIGSRYHEIYARSRRDPEGFWAEAARDIDWYEPAKKVFDPNAGVYGHWFVGATCNTCFNAVDRHVAGGRGAQAALIYDSPVTGSKRTFTYAELLAEVGALAAVLKDFGVERGDRVILYMPMVPEAVIAMLACARIGAIHSVVFGGFAANELATRIDDARPKLVLSASCGIEAGRVVTYKNLLDEAIRLAKSKPQGCLILQRPQAPASLVAGRDHDWAELREKAMAAKKTAACVPVAATDPLYILYTSGTTGQPKGVVRDNGGHMVALRWSMRNLYGVEPGEVYWAASDIGWVVGHSYIVYAPLFHGCTSILYEGKPVGTPDAGAFWRVIAEYGCVALFTAPTSCLPTLWLQDERFKESYLAEFPGYYKTADAGFKDEDGYLYIMSRTDDIINVAGHRLSTGGMEEVLSSHPDVAECAVIGVKDALKGEVPAGFLVLKAGVNRPPAEIEQECCALVREKIGPVASFKLAITVARLPKTRSGKILRGTIKKIADGDPWIMPATIDDPAILDEIGAALKGKGIGI